jgi:hypothetical protein
MALPKIFDYVKLLCARTWYHRDVFVNKHLHEFASMAVAGPRKLGGTKLM